MLIIVAMLFLIVRKLLQQHRLEKQRLDTAINNMTQGLLLFDSSQRLVVCNQRYIEMFGVSTDVVKPGCTIHELLQHRKEIGSFTGDVDEYCANSRAQNGARKGFSNHPGHCRRPFDPGAVPTARRMADG